jgi:hypothetical protein
MMLTRDLNMKKACMRMVLKSISDEQKDRSMVQTYQQDH